MRMDNIKAKRLINENYELFRTVEEQLYELEKAMDLLGVETFMDSTTGEIFDKSELPRVRGILGIFAEPVKIFEITD